MFRAPSVTQKENQQREPGETAEHNSFASIPLPSRGATNSIGLASADPLLDDPCRPSGKGMGTNGICSNPMICSLSNRSPGHWAVCFGDTRIWLVLTFPAA